MNTPTKLFDNIGFRFKVNNEDRFVVGKNIIGYRVLSQSDVGYNIPYLARDIKSGSQWEVGVGSVENDNIGNIVINRLNIVQSSNNNQLVKFANSDSTEFYVFANENNFNTAFNNVIIKNVNFSIEPIKAIYLVDTSSSVIDAVLPENSKSENLIIEIKIIAGDNPVILRNNDGAILLSLNTDNKYTRLAFANNTWYEITAGDGQDIRSLSIDPSLSPTFSALSQPQGDLYSFQYNLDGNTFSGAPLYLSSGNSILFGSDSEIDAHHVIPVSGSDSILFNKDKTNSDFIVNGSGTRNLFFTYDGKLGLNIPSGTRPITVFHVVNTACQESMRLENRSSCNPTSVTLFYKPLGAINNNTKIAQINLSAKNTSGTPVDYAKIEAVAFDVTPGTSKGQIDLVVVSGYNGIKVFSSNTDSTRVGYSGDNSILINKAGTTNIGYNNSSIDVNTSSVSVNSSSFVVNTTSSSLQSSSVTIGSGLSSAVTIQGSLNAANIQSSNITVPSISPSSILTVSSDNKLTAAGSLSFNSIGTISLPIESGKILSTIANGAVTGVYSLTDYFLTEQDITWNKYPTRTASICLRQITFVNPVPVEEYSVGDQVAIETDTELLYRTVESIDTSNNLITGLLLDTTVSSVTVNNIIIYSISRGGYLSISKHTENGAISDATSNILSVRPQTPTVFNTSQKNIDFMVYGVDQDPTLTIRASVGTNMVQSGVYYSFATRDNNIFPIIITTGGAGLNNQYSSANFDYTNGNNLFSGILSDVGTNGVVSYYGTADQNGNVAEWVEKPLIVDLVDLEEIAAGGSYKDPETLSIGSSGLKQIEVLPRTGVYEHVGFRIAGLYNATDSFYISNNLGIHFVSVIDSDNIEDNTTTYLNVDGAYSPISINNLGSVKKFYRIAENEITNRQYIEFLKSVAKVNDRGLYNEKMDSEPVGGITQIELGPDDYDYSLKDNMDNKPVNFVNFLSCIRFVNWLHNGANTTPNESDIDTLLDTGAYTIVPNGANSHIIRKNNYRKYWLPDINEWHKAAYFEPKQTVAQSGTSVITVKRNDPYMVASGVLDNTGVSQQIFANVSVSGWLYVDHLIVGDNVSASSAIPRRRFTPSPPPPGSPPGSPPPSVQCSVNADCGDCALCTGGFCVESTDPCCVANCCNDWNTTTGVCDFCSQCKETTGSGTGSGTGTNTPPGESEVPCELIGTC